MTTNTKEWIQYSTASIMIVSGVVLTFFSFFLNGDVADGVLWYMAQGLTYAGGIFGVSIYFRTKMGESVADIRNFIDKKITELEEKSKEGKEECNDENTEKR